MMTKHIVCIDAYNSFPPLRSRNAVGTVCGGTHHEYYVEGDKETMNYENLKLMQAMLGNRGGKFVHKLLVPVKAAFYSDEVLTAFKRIRVTGATVNYNVMYHDPTKNTEMLSYAARLVASGSTANTITRWSGTTPGITTAKTALNNEQGYFALFADQYYFDNKANYGKTMAHTMYAGGLNSPAIWDYDAETGNYGFRQLGNYLVCYIFWDYENKILFDATSGVQIPLLKVADTVSLFRFGDFINDGVTVFL